MSVEFLQIPNFIGIQFACNNMSSAVAEMAVECCITSRIADFV